MKAVIRLSKYISLYSKNPGRFLVKNFPTMSTSIDNLPKVDIDPSGMFKYILIEVHDPAAASEDPSPPMIVRGYQRCNYHSDIFDEVQEKLKPLDLEAIGGGRISHQPNQKKIHIYGYSQGYGKADHEITAELVKDAYPGYTIIISDSQAGAPAAASTSVGGAHKGNGRVTPVEGRAAGPAPKLSQKPSVVSAPVDGRVAGPAPKLSLKPGTASTPVDGRAAGPAPKLSCPKKPDNGTSSSALQMDDEIANGWTLVGRRAKAKLPVPMTGTGKGKPNPMTNQAKAAGTTQEPAARKNKKNSQNQRRRERKAREALAMATANTTTPGPSTPGYGTGVAPTAPTAAQSGIGNGAQVTAALMLTPGGAAVAAGAARPKTNARPDKRTRAAEKRTRLDDSMSPRGEQKKRKLGGVRQQGVNYSSVVSSDLAIAVTDGVTRYITRDLASEIQVFFSRRIISEAIDKSKRDASGGPPGFSGKPLYEDGHLRLFAEDAFTVEWVRKAITEMPTPSDVKLEVRRQSEMVRRVLCGLFVPDDFGLYPTALDIGKVLLYQNRWAEPNRWLISSAEKQAGGWFITLKVPVDCVPAIVAKNRRLTIGIGTAFLRFKASEGGQFVETPPDLGQVSGSSATHETLRMPVATPMDAEEALLASLRPEDIGSTGEELVGAADAALTSDNSVGEESSADGTAPFEAASVCDDLSSR